MQPLEEFLRDDTAGNIGRAARRKRHDDLDRMVRIAGRMQGRRTVEGERGQQRQNPKALPYRFLPLDRTRRAETADRRRDACYSLGPSLPSSIAQTK
jgi:hypothetical protein